MIKAIFKTTFIIFLCICSALPTMAAISVSDGSAFVTKAEFSADLNNLSNRMAQLENELDSKIDSLVSTYLNKNGIWNAKKVDIDYTYTDLSSSNFITSWTEFSILEKEVWSKSATVDKSGMCIITVHTSGMSNGYGVYRCYLRYTGGVWAGFEDDMRMMIWFKEIENGVNYERNAQQIGCSAQRVTNGNPEATGECVMPLPADQDTVLLGFVTKGNTIKVGMTQYLSDFQTGSSNISSCGIYGAARYRVQIVDCNVY